jgi:uncharacterized protein YjiS (DUF1127 family)
MMMSTLALAATAAAAAKPETGGIGGRLPPARAAFALLARGWAHFATGGGKLIAYAAERRRRRRAVTALEGLSDRMLADIGLERCDIARVARYGRDASDRRALRAEIE